MTDRRGVYREDGGVWRVRILSDATDKRGTRTAELECIEEIRASPIHGSIPVGRRFSPQCVAGADFLWSLDEDVLQPN